MRTDEQRQRYEQLCERERAGALSDEERIELAALLQELKEHEAAHLAAANERKAEEIAATAAAVERPRASSPSGTCGPENAWPPSATSSMPSWLRISAAIIPKSHWEDRDASSKSIRRKPENCNTKSRSTPTGFWPCRSARTVSCWLRPIDPAGCTCGRR